MGRVLLDNDCWPSSHSHRHAQHSLYPVALARSQQLPSAGFFNELLTQAKVRALLQERFAQ